MEYIKGENIFTLSVYNSIQIKLNRKTV
jgi:hypothetical protein